MKRKICNVEFEVLSPSFYQRDGLQLFYSGEQTRWHVAYDNGTIDPVGHPSKEHAVHHLICTYHNFG